MSRYNGLSNACSARSLIPLSVPVAVVRRLVYPDVTPAPVAGMEFSGPARFHDVVTGEPPCLDGQAAQEFLKSCTP
jgi:hypothetical protein